MQTIWTNSTNNLDRKTSTKNIVISHKSALMHVNTGTSAQKHKSVYGQIPIMAKVGE
jgi:hypothetical protein